MLFVKEIKSTGCKENVYFVDAITDFIKNNSKDIELLSDFDDKITKFNISNFNHNLISELAMQIQLCKKSQELNDFIDESSDYVDTLSLKESIQLYMEIENIQEISFIIVNEISRTKSEVYDIIVAKENVLKTFLGRYEIKLVS